MEKVDLKKHKELLDLEEEVLEGLELTSYGVRGGLLSKELKTQLPYLYYDFKNLEARGEKIEKLRDNVENGKPWREYFIYDSNASVWRGREGQSYFIETAAYIGPAAIMIILAKAGHLAITSLAKGVVPFLCTMGFWAQFAAFPSLLGPAPYMGPAGCAKALADKATYKTRKKSALRRAERKKEKLENKIRADIALANAGKLEYAKDWLGKEKKKLEELLVSAHQEFPERFTKLQQITKPEDQLELYKHFEELAKHSNQDLLTKERAKHHSQRYNIANVCGIYTGEAKKDFKKELKRREKSFKMFLEPLENLPEDLGKKKLTREIEEIASLEYHLQKYDNINEERKELLRKFYKERPELAWTAKSGHLDRFTLDSLKFTRSQKICGVSTIITITSLIATALIMGDTNLLFWPVMGIEMIPFSASILATMKDERATRQIRRYLGERRREGELVH